MGKLPKNNLLFENIRRLIIQSRKQVLRQVNQIMVMTYFEIGRMIVEDEQQGSERAAYAKSTIKNLSEKLAEEFGRGFSYSNLEYMRRFYLSYSNSQTLSGDFKLSWSHYVFLLKINDLPERKFHAA